MSDNKEVKKVSGTAIQGQYKKQSQLGEVWKRLRKNKAAMIGLVIVIILVLTAILSPLLFDYDEVVIKTDIINAKQSPSSEHWFGTDEMGRDIFARICYGSRASLSIAAITVACSLAVGLVFGSLAGFYGGKVDMIIMRVMDVFLAIPGTLLAICIVAALGTGTSKLIIALSVSSVPSFSRIVRGAVLTVRNSEYIQAAHAIGAKDRIVIFSHVLPNALAPIIVQVTLRMADIILTIAGLSFLGLGIQPPSPEWGAMLSSGRSFIRDYSYMTAFPGLAIMIT
ncbi:MAG: ABC transporter permease, partial [Lachnospiraceae bacterium]|nr:ABC transporter permease [Lachnospiraceae bacterium]